MIPLYVHVPVVLALLGAHAWTFTTFKRRLETLQMALAARRVLLKETNFTGPNVIRLEGGTRCRIGNHIIEANRPVTLSVVPAP